MDPKTTLPIVISSLSLLIAASSLAVVIWREFFAGPKLSSAVHTVTVLKLPAGNQKLFLLPVLIDDLASGSPSSQARDAISTVPEASRRVLESGDRARIQAELNSLLVNPATRIQYNADPGRLERYAQRPEIVTPLFVPLVIHNSGKKAIYLASIVLILADQGNSERRWAYTCFVEMNPDSLLHRGAGQTDADRLSAIFVGAMIGAGETVTVNGVFQHVSEANGTILNREGVYAGDYRVWAVGYGAGEKRLFKTDAVDLKIKVEILTQAAMGADSAIRTVDDAHILDAFRS